MLKTKREVQGFTLIELMIVVAIVAILSTIAYASYQGQVARSNRAAAVGFVMEVANRQERFLLDNREYATGANALTDLNMVEPGEVSDNYDISIDDPEPTTPVPTYRIIATPTGAQAQRDSGCGELTLNSRGQRTASGGGARCWR